MEEDNKGLPIETNVQGHAMSKLGEALQQLGLPMTLSRPGKVSFEKASIISCRFTHMCPIDAQIAAGTKWRREAKPPPLYPANPELALQSVVKIIKSTTSMSIHIIHTKSMG